MRGIWRLLAFGLVFLADSTFSTGADEAACCDKIHEMKNLVNDMKSKIHQLHENKIDESQLTRQIDSTSSTVVDEGVCCDKLDGMNELMYEIKSEIHRLYEDSRRTMVLGGSYCPPGFVFLPKSDSCYKVIQDAKRTWSSASQKCQDLFDGAHLAVITSEKETEAVNWLIRHEISNSQNMDCSPSEWTQGGNQFWIAGQRLDINTCNSRFVWKLPGTTELSMTYSNWLSGEPNCGNSVEHCAHIWQARQYQWNDAPCGNHICAICEYNYNA